MRTLLLWYFALLGLGLGLCSNGEGEMNRNSTFLQPIVVSDMESLQHCHLRDAFYNAPECGWRRREARVAILDEFDFLIFNKVQQQLLLCHDEVDMIAALPMLQTVYHAALASASAQEAAAGACALLNNGMGFFAAVAEIIFCGARRGGGGGGLQLEAARRGRAVRAPP